MLHLTSGGCLRLSVLSCCGSLSILPATLYPSCMFSGCNYLKNLFLLMCESHCSSDPFSPKTEKPSVTPQACLLLKTWSCLAPSLTNIPPSVGLVTHFSFIVMEYLNPLDAILPPTYNKPRPLSSPSGWPVKLLLSIQLELLCALH